jgi:hypothetical protein
MEPTSGAAGPVVADFGSDHGPTILAGTLKLISTASPTMPSWPELAVLPSAAPVASWCAPIARWKRRFAVSALRPGSQASAIERASRRRFRSTRPARLDHYRMKRGLKRIAPERGQSRAKSSIPRAMDIPRIPTSCVRMWGSDCRHSAACWR